MDIYNYANPEEIRKVSETIKWEDLLSALEVYKKARDRGWENKPISDSEWIKINIQKYK